MKKSDRELIRMKFNNRCAYCGCELRKGWHVDEIEPVRRSFEYLKDDTGKRLYKDGEPVKKAIMLHPERLCIENQNPACASCNINKHSDDLETFRNRILQFVVSLNKYSVQYKVVKRFGLIHETGITDVKFYFETINQLMSK